MLGLAAHGLAVGDLRPAHVRVHLEFSQHPVDQHLEVQLAHAGDLCLPGLLVGPHLEGRVLLGQAAEGGRHLLLVGLGLRLDRDLDHRLGEFDRLELDRLVGGRERVAGGHLLDADGGGDVAGVDLGDLLALVGVHHQDAADALGATGGDVEDPRAGLELARVGPEVGELADVGVGHDLERQRRERLVVGGVAHGRLAAVVRALPGLEALDRGHVERAREVVDHRVQQRLHALVLEARAAQHWSQRDRQRRLADRGLEAIDWDLLLLENHLEQVVVVVGDLLEQVLAGGTRLVGELLGDLDDVLVLAELVLVNDRLHRHQIDDSAEVRLRADRQLDRDRVRPKAVDHRLHAAREVRADPVHLVDVGDPRHVVLVGLAPHGLGLRLDAGDRVEQRDRAVEHAQRALHLDGEVDVARRVDDVDPVTLPLGRGGRRGDRDPSLLLLGHPVHHGRALVNLPHLVGPPGVIEDALSRRRLTGVDVSHDPDVPGVFERELTRHCVSLVNLSAAARLQT